MSNPVYKVVQVVGNRMVVTRLDNISEWARANGREVYYTDHSFHLRPEIRFQPRVTGLCGPMYDGEQNGVPVVRYEDGPTNDILSR